MACATSDPRTGVQALILAEGLATVPLLPENISDAVSLAHCPGTAAACLRSGRSAQLSRVESGCRSPRLEPRIRWPRRSRLWVMSLTSYQAAPPRGTTLVIEGPG